MLGVKYLIKSRQILMLGVFLGLSLLAGDSVRWPARLVTHYGSLPKGVILEGQAQGFAEISTIKYDPLRNGFILNKDSFYPLPLSRSVVAEIFTALARDDRLGVSMPGRRRVVYGNLLEKGEVATALFAADILLTAIVFGQTQNLRGIKLPKDYQPVSTPRRRVRAVNVNKFYDYKFRRQDGVYYIAGVKMANLLTPLHLRQAADGGFLPGRTPERLPAGDRQNVRYLQENALAVLALPTLKRAVHIGEVAAFGRLLRDTGNLNLNDLTRHMLRRAAQP